MKYLFFVLEIFTLLYYANEESDDAINGYTLTIKYSIKNISINILTSGIHAQKPK